MKGFSCYQKKQDLGCIWPTNIISSFSKKDGVKNKQSITAIVACYKDGEAIPEMYERLVKVFQKEEIDYEIIFENLTSEMNE